MPSSPPSREGKNRRNWRKSSDIRVISDRLKRSLQFQGKVSRTTSRRGNRSRAGRPLAPVGPGRGEGALGNWRPSVRPACRPESGAGTGGAGRPPTGTSALVQRSIPGISSPGSGTSRFGGRCWKACCIEKCPGQLKPPGRPDFQVREINRSIQKTLVQAAPVRKWFADPGPGPARL